MLFLKMPLMLFLNSLETKQIENATLQQKSAVVSYTIFRENRVPSPVS